MMPPADRVGMNTGVGAQGSQAPVGRRHGDCLGRNLANTAFERESRRRDGNAERQNRELEFEACSHDRLPLIEFVFSEELRV